MTLVDRDRDATETEVFLRDVEGAWTPFVVVDTAFDEGALPWGGMAGTALAEASSFADAIAAAATFLPLAALGRDFTAPVAR